MSSPVAKTALKIAVLHGSVREGRFGIQLVNTIVAAAKTAGHQVTLFDAKELKFPLLEKPFHHYKPDSPAPEWLASVARQFDESDAFIIVDGEYNHGPTPGILNLLDHFYGSMYRYKAAGIATYGALAGGARSAYALRNTLGELGLVVAPTLFSVPNIWAAFSGENQLKEEAATASLNKFLTEFGFLAATLRDVRKDITFKL